ncbi:MAG: hypothetical protein BCS36_02735 [Desulfovibrio sp. MES5]|nr:MAG: hypothetical protein BCS36_02735 [Desulfovibrio sp. MES5]
MYISAMRRSKFSGVYSFSTDWTGNNRKNHYFVWELSDGAFAVQELNKAFQPLAEPERISASSFAKNFRAEPEILAMPVMTPDLSHLEAKGKSADGSGTAQQAGQADTAASEPSGETSPRPKTPATPGAPPDAATSGSAAGGTPARTSGGETGNASAALKSRAQSGTQPTPQAGPQSLDSLLFANESDSLVASVSQSAATPGALRPKQARKLAPESLRPVATDEPEGLKRAAATQKNEVAAPARTPQLRLQPVEKDILTAATDTPARRVQPDVSPTAMSRPMDLEAMRKAKMTEARLRETFRQTLLRLRRPRERKGALAALEQLAQSTENICTAHKHMFRDFGVSLRQNSQLALALLFSRRVVELAPDDDHAHFNLARILCSLGHFDEAAAHVRTAMNMGGEEPLYFRMLVHIRKEMLQKRGQSASRDR